MVLESAVDTGKSAQALGAPAKFEKYSHHPIGDRDFFNHPTAAPSYTPRLYTAFPRSTEASRTISLQPFWLTPFADRTREQLLVPATAGSATRHSKRSTI